MRSQLLRFRRPGFVLGLLLTGLLVALSSFCYWQVFLLDAEAAERLTGQQWVLLLAAATATVGWIVTSWVNVRNSVKQHTINTLLQSRLSVEYMKHATAVGGHYKRYGERKKAGTLNNEEIPTDGVDEHSLQYILNYFEFIALGIRAGDLHEAMLKDSLRSIVARNVKMSKSWIDECRDDVPRLYENLGWLHHRWNPTEVQLKRHKDTRW